MGFFDNKKEIVQGQENAVQPEVVACDKELAELEQRRRELYLKIGKRYVEEVSVEKAEGTPYEEDITGLDKITARTELLNKRKLANNKGIHLAMNALLYSMNIF